MQNFSQTPIFSDVADWYAYPALTAGQVKTITIAQALGSGKAYITLQPEHYFLFCGFASQTNYDNGGQVRATAAAAGTPGLANAVIALPSTPNTFEVEIQRGSSNNYSNVKLTQAEVCSSGLLSGKQNPFPVIYGPAVTLSFQFTDLTGLYLLNQAGSALSLQIQFWMLGYTIPVDNFDRLLEYFPGLQQEYRGPMNGRSARQLSRV